MYWKPKRFVRLGELPDDKLFPELEQGLTLAGQNVGRLASAATVLAEQGHVRPANILGGHASDEAGKFLILLDAARCPRGPQLAAHLRRAGDHLSRLLFAEVASWHAVTYGEMVRYIDGNRQSHYLDGPEGVEWVYRNSLLYWREQAMYADYVEMEDKSCQWQDPDYFEKLDASLWKRPWAADVVENLMVADLHRAPSLAIIAQHWRSFEPRGDTHISETAAIMDKMLEDLHGRGMLQGDKQVWSRIADRWAFPLWSAETSEIKVKLEDLLEERERYSPEY
jgi:hypothetical protein